ncbi:MAG: hypothetical protein Q9226_007025 [Calogaya cf. arnoldii]
MADPISLASGLVALTTFALQSSKTLFQAIESFKSNRKAIRDLREELEALNGVLRSLAETATGNETHLDALKLPLLRCGAACKDFEAVVIKCSAHSDGSKTSFRDWAKLTYIGEDVTGFRNMLAGYKSTISIALGDANIRKAAVTARVLEQYKDLITNTTTDLEERLQEIDGKLQELSLQKLRLTDDEMLHQQHLEEERDSTRQCLRICAEVAKHMDHLHLSTQEPVHPNTGQAVVSVLGNSFSARRATGATIQECKEKLRNTNYELENHLRKINSRLASLTVANSKTDKEAEEKRIQEEKDCVEQCLGICAEAAGQADHDRTNVVEDISSGHGSYQVVVATLGDLIAARRLITGDKSTQWVGQMSDTTLQQLSRDRGYGSTREATQEECQQPMFVRSETAKGFEHRHGTGYKLSPNHSSDSVG